MKDAIFEKELIEAFKKFDRRGNGLMDAHEFRHVLKNLFQELTDEEIDEIIDKPDGDIEYIINYEEFIRMKLAKMTVQ
jgi:calmodulin